jgi:hypothetical protein
LQFLVSHILSTSGAEAAIIDTTGAFDVVRLHQIVISRFRAKDPSINAESEAEVALQKVRIIRVFDFFGVVEAINEIRETLDDHDRLSKPSPTSARRAAHRRLGIIPDSEDEEDPEDLEVEVEDSEAQPLSIGFIVIDNLTTVINPLLKSNHVNGKQALFLSCDGSVTIE